MWLALVSLGPDDQSGSRLGGWPISRQGGRIRYGEVRAGSGAVEVWEAWEGVGRARPRSNRLLQRMESRDWSWPPWDASEVSGGEVPNATMAMLRRWATKFQRRARELIGRATCQQRSLSAGGEDRAEGHPPEWSRTFRPKKRRRCLFGRRSRGSVLDREEERGTGTGGGRWRLETAPTSNGKLGSARRNGAADVAWPTRINIANKPAGVGMEQKKHGLFCVVEGRGSSGRRVRPAQDGRPFFWFKALCPWAQMNEPRGGVVRDGPFTNGVYEVFPSGGLARARHQTLPEGSNMTTYVRSSPTTSETASRTLHLVANLPSQSIPHPPLRGCRDKAVRSCSWMAGHRPWAVPDPA